MTSSSWVIFEMIQQTGRFSDHDSQELTLRAATHAPGYIFCIALQAVASHCSSTQFTPTSMSIVRPLEGDDHSAQSAPQRRRAPCTVRPLSGPLLPTAENSIYIPWSASRRPRQGLALVLALLHPHALSASPSRGGSTTCCGRVWCKEGHDQARRA